MLIQLILWGLCAGLKCGVKTDHLIEFIDLLGDFSHEPGTRQLQCNPKRSYWAPKENIPLAKSVGASVNIGDKQQGQQRQEQFPVGCAGTWVIHTLRTSVSCCFHLWDKAKGKRISSYMSCCLCLCNTKQATLKQNWSKCVCCFTARIKDGLTEEPSHAWEEQSLRHQFRNRCKAFGMTASQLDL